jgi:hypothetical protein
MSDEFKTSGSISISEINNFIDKYIREPTADTRSAKNVESLFDLMEINEFELPNGNFDRPHALGEVYGAIPRLSAWYLPTIGSWARLEWDGTNHSVPLRSRECNIPTNNYTDENIIFKFSRSTYPAANDSGGRFVTYRATSYAKDPGVSHPLPAEIKNESRYYGLWAANSWWDWSTLGEINSWVGGTINGIPYGSCTDLNGTNDTGPGTFVRFPNSPSNRTVYEWIKGDQYDYNEGDYYTSGRSTSWGNCNQALFPGAPSSETKTLQDALMYWDTNDIPYTYWQGLAQASKLQGNLEQFNRYNWGFNNPYNVAAKNISIDGVLTPQTTDFHLKISGGNESVIHIPLESGQYTENNGIFDEYKTIYYQTGLVYIRNDQTVSSNFGLNFNHDKCANGYMKIEVGASPEYLVLPFGGGSWGVIGAEDIVPNGSSFTTKSSVSYIRTFSNKSDAVGHWMELQYKEHFYRMNTNIESSGFKVGTNYSTFSWGDRVPGRSYHYFNQTSKRESDWCFYLTQRTKGSLNDFGFTENNEYKTYGQFYEYLNNDAYSNYSSFGWNTRTYVYTDDPTTCYRARWKGSKYKFDLLYNAYVEKNIYQGTRLSDEQHMPRMHSGLKIEVKYIIELRIAHQIQIERAVRYCEKLSATDSFQLLYVWPFDENFATSYGASVPSGTFNVIGHATANSNWKYLHINIDTLESYTNLYNDAVSAIRSAFGV